jgi:predicted YcjX-like family ATPase
MKRLRDIIDRAPDWLRERNILGWLAEHNITQLAKGSTVWVAVTGLSRSGKTVFISSLIHNLLSATHNRNRLPLFAAVTEGRIKAARMAALEANVLPQFPYEANIRKMTAVPPVWPERTSDISEIEIDILFSPKGIVSRLNETATLKIKIVDYPGEWLLDLPMLEQRYVRWSADTIERLREGARAGIAREFLTFIAEHSVDEPASDEVARKAHELYRTFLRTARDEHGLSYLQPGRFLCPGGIGNDVPFLWFAPLDMAGRVDGPAEGTLGVLMQQRFEVYKKRVVEDFYQTYFRRFSRQIVLVDVLRAYMAGPDAFDDTRLAVKAIMQSFQYGRRGILRRLLLGTPIDKVLLAATKADHVPQVQRDYLAQLLHNLAAEYVSNVKGEDASIQVVPLASVVSTTDDTEEIAGRRVEIVVGRPVGAEVQRGFFAGFIPIKPPRPGQWNAPFLDVPNFEPPPIDRAPVDGIPHINLDVALDYLIGDFVK